MKGRLAAAFYLALLFLLCAGCGGSPAALTESIPPSVEALGPPVASMESIPPSVEVLEPEVNSAPPKPSKQPAATDRLVFPEERVFTCAAGYSSAEEPIHFSKDEVENGWVCYDKSLVPFSDYLLEHPDASLLMLCGVHEYMLESWEIPLNDGWICYMYRGETDHATGAFDPGGRGTIYRAMIGRPGDESVFCLFWNNYIETPFEEPLESFHEGDPGYVSIEDMRSFLSGITVEGYARRP